MISTAFFIVIPDYTLPMVNEWRGRHWSKRSRAKAVAADILKVYAHLAGVPDAAGKRRVGITLHGWPSGTLPDPDAFLKDALDALKTAKLIVDDSQKWVEWTMPVIVRSKGRRTEIALEDLS